MELVALWYGGGSLLDRASKSLTRSQYRHVALIVRDTARVTVYEGLANGLNRHDGAAAKSVAAAAAASKRLTATHQQITAVEIFYGRLLKAHAGYDFSQLLVDAFNAVTGEQLIIGTGSRMVCSAATAT